MAVATIRRTGDGPSAYTVTLYDDATEARAAVSATADKSRFLTNSFDGQFGDMVVDVTIVDETGE